MKPEDLYQYQDFLDYAKRLKLSPFLIEICLNTMVLSNIAGDGSLFTDSILGTALEHHESQISSSLSTFVGTRGNIIQDIVSESSFTSQILTEGYTFQIPVDLAIRSHLAYNPNDIIDEKKLFAIEIREAIDSYGHTHSALALFIEHLFSPLNHWECEIEKIKGGLYALNKFRSFFIDAFTLSIMTVIHPFDIFKPNPEVQESLGILKYKYHRKYRRPMLIFLLYIRDCAKVSSRFVPDTIFELILDQWIDDEFIAAIDDIDLLSDLDFDYMSSCYFAASKLEKYNIPTALLLEKLECLKNNDDIACWPNNDVLMVYLSPTGAINVAPADILGIKNYETSSLSNIAAVKAHCGIIAPNPIWNETVVDRLEWLINKHDIKESELDLFFNMYPSFILDDLHCSILPQLILLKETGGTLRPDFIVQRADSKYVDIVEIKRPIPKLVSGTFDRPILTREFAKAIAQLKEYRDWFRIQSHRKWFRRKYGLEGYEPALTLIIGRSTGFKNEIVRKQVLEGSNINVITYDELLLISKRRREAIKF